MQLTFREIMHADADALAQLSLQFGYSVTVEEMQRRIGQLLIREDHCGFVALTQHQVVGWIHGFHTVRLESEAFVEIGGIVVAEHFRRQGIGQQLIEQVEIWATGFPAHKIRVRCNTQRIDAHAFYNEIGFEFKKEQKVFDLIIS
jgi:GNAT superfamily N-acetyltransferase